MTNFYRTIARLYDSEHHDKDEDFEFYEQIADQAALLAGGAGDGADTRRTPRRRAAGGTAVSNATIAIIGSGTGRLALHLAERGHTVHGIEIEAEMIARTQAKLDKAPALRERVHFYQHDALTFSPPITPPAVCNLAIIPYNTLMHFTDPAQVETLFRRIHGYLAPGGVLAIDLPNAGEAFAAQDTEAVVLERMFTEQETGHTVMQQSSSRLDRVEQIMAVTWIYDEVTGDGTLKRTVIPVELRYFFHNEMRLLLQVCGFDLEAAFGDFDGSEFSDGAPRMVCIARRK